MAWYGFKKSMIAESPILVVADSRIITDAPMRLTASGVGDLLGKYTALADFPVNDIPFDRGGGHLHLSHREGVEDGLRMLPRLCKIEQRNGLQPDIPIVGQGEGAGEPVAEHRRLLRRFVSI